MVTVDQVRELALALPRTVQAVVRDQLKFKVGRIVYISIAPDEQSLGFAYPKHERAALIDARPATFFPPIRSEERFNWVQAWLPAIDPAELPELVVEAWCLAVPKRVASDYFAEPGRLA